MTNARRIIITGAASGIGRSVSELAADGGATLFLVDRDENKLEDARREIAAQGASVHVLVGDLSCPDVCAETVEAAAEAMGGIDVLVSNAGFASAGTLLETTVDDFDLMMALNARSHWLLGRAAHRWLAESGGSIVVTASICGHYPAVPLPTYSAAKAALLMLVKQMAVEWGPDGIRVNSVSPGPTVTGQTEGIFNDLNDDQQLQMRQAREARIPLRKVGTAVEVANAIMFLAGEGASQITGRDLLIDGGSLVNALPALGAGSR